MYTTRWWVGEVLPPLVPVHMRVAKGEGRVGVGVTFLCVFFLCGKLIYSLNVSIKHAGRWCRESLPHPPHFQQLHVRLDVTLYVTET